MGKDVIIRGETYNGVGKVNLLTANGSANFYDVSGALCTITAEYDEVEEYDEVYTSDKTAQEVYDALEVGINPVFRFHNLLDTDTYIYASLTKLESTADGEELTLSSFQTDAMIADTLSDVFTLTVHGEAPAVEKTVSGSLITITDALAAPAVALSTAINPAQDLHGYDSPWPAGGGSNILPFVGNSGPYIGTTASYDADEQAYIIDGTTTSPGNIILSWVPNGSIRIQDAPTSGRYTLSVDVISGSMEIASGTGSTFAVALFNSNASAYMRGDTTGSTLVGYQGYIANSGIAATGSAYQLMLQCWRVGTVFNNLKFRIKIEDAVNPPITWTPYSNICPISGFSAANIVVSPTTTAGDGTTYTVSFGTAGTVYGGILDVTNGTLTVNMAITDLGSYTWLSDANRPWAWRTFELRNAGIKGDGTDNAKIVCSAYATQNHGVGQHLNSTVSSTPSYGWGNIIVQNDSFSGITAEDVKTALTGVQLAYELATPLTYTLTPTEVQMLLGTNNVWSDTGDTTLTYLADGRVNSLTALNMLLGNMYTPSADVSDREALQIIMGETE